MALSACISQEHLNDAMEEQQIATAAASANATEEEAPDNILCRPKRPLSAYNLFFQCERKQLLESRPVRAQGVPRRGHGKMSFSEMGKTIASKWNTIDAETKAHFDALAAVEKLNYRKKLAEWKLLTAPKTRKSSSKSKKAIKKNKSPSKKNTIISSSSSATLSATTLSTPTLLPATVSDTSLAEDQPIAPREPAQQVSLMPPMAFAPATAALMQLEEEQQAENQANMLDAWDFNDSLDDFLAMEEEEQQQGAEEVLPLQSIQPESAVQEQLMAPPPPRQMQKMPQAPSVLLPPPQAAVVSADPAIFATSVVPPNAILPIAPKTTTMAASPTLDAIKPSSFQCIAPSCSHILNAGIQVLANELDAESTDFFIGLFQQV